MELSMAEENHSTPSETPTEPDQAKDVTASMPAQPISAREKKRTFVMIVLLLIVAMSSILFAIWGVQRLQEKPGFSWTSRNMVALYATSGAFAFFAVAFFMHRKYKQSSPKHLAYWLCFTLLGLNGLWTWQALRAMRQAADFSWTFPKAIALYFASGILSFGILAFLVLMRRATTRWEMEERLRLDGDIHDWLVLFNWTKKILHVPTICCSFLAAFAVWLFPEAGKVVGALWFCVWLFCHTIEDNDIGLSVAIAMFVCVLLFVVLAIFGGVLDDIADLARLISLTASPSLYIGFGLVYLISILISYIKGLFYYVAIEPNQMIVQFKIGEDGETFQRTQYDARVEATADIFEWFFFDTATIKIQFRDGKRSPMEYYVGRIRRKARYLSAVLGVTAIDRARRTG
jgi:hypothetical protein